MTQRSPGPRGPDDWGTDGFARGQYYGSGTAGFYGSAEADGYDAGGADPFGARAADPFGDGAGAGTDDGYRAGTDDGYHAGTGSGYGARTDDGYHAGTGSGYGARTAAYGAGAYGAGIARAYDGDAHEAGTAGACGAGTAGTGEAGFAGTGTEAPTAMLPAAPRRQAAGTGFLGALFDFGFTSLVTPKVIRVLYVLIMIGTVVSALALTITMFKVSATLGILTLVFGAPLFVLIVLAIYRVILEFFMVAYRIADDIRALRERGDTR